MILTSIRIFNKTFTILFLRVLLAQFKFRSNTQDSVRPIPNTSKFVKNTRLCVVFLTLFSVFGNVVKHCPSCSTSKFTSNVRIFDENTDERFR